MRTPAGLLFLALVFFTGCATPEYRDHSQPIAISKIPYSLSALDKIRIVTGGRETVLVVPHEGPLETAGGPIAVRGRSREVVLSRLRSIYPSASIIEIEEFRTNRVTVLGEVFHQIHTDLGDGPMRVMDAIASANGFTAIANKRRVRLVRQNAGFVEVYELDLRETMLGYDLIQNMLLKPGDVITVPRNFL